MCVCVRGGRVAFFPSPPSPPRPAFPSFASGRDGGGGASRPGTPGASAWAAVGAAVPGTAVPAWVLGFSLPGPTLLNAGMFRETIQGLNSLGENK